MKRLIAVIMVLLLYVSGILANGPVPGGEAAPVPAEITGTVKDGATGMEGISITLIGPTPGTTLTAKDGSYSFIYLEAGEYIIEVSVPAGYDIKQNQIPLSLYWGDEITVDFTLTALPGTIVVNITPAFTGVTVYVSSLSDYYSMLTENGSCAFTENGSCAFINIAAGGGTDYAVGLILPLGFSVNMEEVNVTLVGGTTETVLFNLDAIVTSNQARSKGYWKHQVNVIVSGNGNAEYGEIEMLGFVADIFSYFYGNPMNTIAVPGVTYVDDPPERALNIGDLEYMLTINQNGSTMNERAKQQYLALLLNVVSLKLPQGIPATEDGATVAQAILHINNLLEVDDELAKDIAETLNQGELVAAGIFPSGLPNIIFVDELQEVLLLPCTFSFNSPAPNPFNPTTTFSFTLSETSNVTLAVYDINGRLVSTLVDGHRNAGSYVIVFDGAGLASGVYVYHLDAGENQITGKMVLMK